MEEINSTPSVAKSRPFLKIPFLAVFVILMMSLLSLATYLILQSPAPSPKPESIFIPKPSPTPDPTINWKTYTNTKYGYSIKYPKEWKEELKCEGGRSEDDYICFLSPDFTESMSGAVLGSTLTGGFLWIDGKEGLVSNPSDGFCQSGGPIAITDCKEITVDNSKAMQRKINKTEMQVGILKDGKFILDLTLIYNSKNEKDFLDLFDQILSTFKFTDQNPTSISAQAITLTDIPPLYPGLNWRKKTKTEPDYVSYEQTYTKKNNNQEFETIRYPLKDGEEWEANVANLSLEDYRKKRDDFWSYYKAAFTHMGWKIDYGARNSLQKGMVSAHLFSYVGLRDGKFRVFINDDSVTAQGARYLIFISDIISLDNIPPSLIPAFR